MTAGWWSLIVLLALTIHGFSAMFEMAAVSINRLRLSYEIAQGSRRAARMAQLLEQPLQLFGALLLLLNVALVIGSEGARQFYEALGINPDYSAISQVLLVIVVGELAPMFAARRHPERVARATVDIVYWVSRLLLPVTWVLEGVAALVGGLFGKTRTGEVFAMTRDELERLWEEPERGLLQDASQAVAANILALRHRTARDAMLPLTELPSVEMHATVDQVRMALSRSPIPWIPIRRGSAVVGLASPRPLLQRDGHSLARDTLRPCWFISEETPLSEILRQLRTNKQSAGVVLDTSARAVGIMTLDAILEIIFHPVGAQRAPKRALLVDRLVPGSMTLEALVQELPLPLTAEPEITLSQWMTQQLGHRPDAGEMLRVGDFQFTVHETALLGIKSIRIQSIPA
jgi:putative hemolysin